jgi:predicted dehydrogenase
VGAAHVFSLRSIHGFSHFGNSKKFDIMAIHDFNINRRRFIKGAAASLALTSFGAYGLDIIYPEKAYRVALVGSGWYGKSDLFRLIQVSPVEVVGIADVDANMLKGAAELVATRQKSRKKPPVFSDYKKMLSETKPDIVLIGSPDHWHALQAIDSIKAGAHVYLQKPISVDVREGEAILDAARKHNRVVQIGTQRRSTPHLIDAKKNIVEAGLLGKISHVELCCYYHMRGNNKLEVQQVPDFFDYENWTGPAPMRPFTGLPHRRWRQFMEYGNGIVGDMCVHMLDAARWTLGLGWPKRITSTGGIYVQKEGDANISDTQTALFEFDELTCVWTHRTWGTPADPQYPWSYKFYGEKGTLSCSTMSYDFVPVDRNGQKIHKDVVFEKEQYPEDLTEEGIELNAAPATRRQMLDFLGAIQEKRRPVADVEEGYISTASCILANMSMELGGRPLVYDPTKREVKGDAEATAMLKREYRKGWVHP